MAEALNCHPGYISQVLKKSKIHFSPESVIKIANFLELDLREQDYLLNLLHLERSGSEDLKRYYARKVQAIQEENQQIAGKIQKVSTELDEVAKGVYYGHWAYGAVHMIVSIDRYRTVKTISEHLKISKALTQRILDFLMEKGLIALVDGKYEHGKCRIHLKKSSPYIRSHHQNFRHKAIQSLEEERELDLHYSSVMTLSKVDAFKIKDLILRLIEDKERILAPSPNEEIVCLNLDLFEL